MTAPKIYGWCPGALRPMVSGDGLVVRIRAPLGRLKPDQTAGIAALSLRHGNGLIDLSARANLQLRGIQKAEYAPLINGLKRLGLIDADIRRESRRNLMIAPFWRRQDDTYRVARSLAQALARPDAPDLPGKFGFAVDCGPAPVLCASPADIRIERAATGLICRADGMEMGLQTDAGSAAQVALDLADWFLKTGGARAGRGRMAQHLATTALPKRHDIPRLAAATPPGPGVGTHGALVALEFGQIHAQTLAALAPLGPIRLTPWRMLLLEQAHRLPAHPQLITHPHDPRLSISVCTGAPGCKQSLSETRALARKLAGVLPRYASRPVHISGCAKGCAHPQPCAVTLTATGPDRFDLIRNGRAADAPARTGLHPHDILNGEL